MSVAGLSVAGMGKFTADPDRLLPLGLSEMLGDPRCPIRAFFDEFVHPNGMAALAANFRSQVGKVGELVENPQARGRRIAPPAGTLLGQRLQLAFSRTFHSTGVVIGVDLPEHADGLDVGRLCDRSLPMYRGLELEKQFLAQYHLGDGLLTADERSAAVLDVATQLEAASAPSALGSLRDSTRPDDCFLEVTFATSVEEEMAAYADLIADGFLIEIKATRRPTSCDKRPLQQLISYLLLDYPDVWGIHRVGLYLTRAACLVSWTIDELLTLLGTDYDLEELREMMRVYIHETRYW